MTQTLDTFHQHARRAALVLLAVVGLATAEAVMADAGSEPGEASVQVAASADTVRVAEPFDIRLTVRVPAGTQVHWPAVGEQLGAFDVIDHEDIDDLPAPDDPNTRLWTRRYTLENIVPGDMFVPEIEVRVGKGAAARTVRSNTVPVRVASTLEGRADPTQYRDIRSVIDLDEPTNARPGRWLLWIGGIGLVALGSASVLFVARQRARLTPAGLAHRQLKTLRNMLDADTSTGTGDAAGEFSLILRHYLASQFEIAAPAQTTQELLHTIQQRKLISPELASRFNALFESIDLASFAGVAMSPAEFHEAINQADQLIDAAASEPADREPEPVKEAA